MTISQEQIREAIEKADTNLSPNMQKKTEEAIGKILGGNIPPKEALGFDENAMNQIYRHGFNEFQAGRYDEALKIFTFLRQIDVGNFDYSFAIAACHQFKQEYSEAAANYIICTYIDRLNPVPHFHLYDCFVKLNFPMSALKAIKETIALAELNPRDSELKERALLEYKSFKKDLKKYLKENFDKENLDKDFVDIEGD
ncbi:Uncharacterized protein PRO82_001407 [Candidatus Protochlamydia amoebophila]|uniref:SycD/LcrH family type III secretion system chaperone n=1 Tax=Candidatus Protochlamydia amoebophila TaxID=362787 RepID=UPI001BC9576D|nr:SycD/LcrH family type III secretion system chaperone [Candidatus Protochlamydia amoebophila]MBS4164091.1 Uncharacterized protein [Candidatus Protochlamydia amoebophila]